MNSSNIEQGEIIVADIGYSNQEGTKRRLALVISSTEYNKTALDVITLKITSKPKNKTFDVSITNQDTLNQNLAKPSVIRTDYPFVVEKQNILQRTDKITAEKLVEAKQKIKIVFKL
ncbi:MAG: type II toxin-antitoxin system PemK/MazF family toxin [Candidatus Micrarchaeota archaeon]